MYFFSETGVRMLYMQGGGGYHTTPSSGAARQGKKISLQCPFLRLVCILFLPWHEAAVAPAWLISIFFENFPSYEYIPTE